MLKKTFIMLAAPSMIGKTCAANRLQAEHPSLLVVHNDDLMKGLCGLARFPVPDISKEEVWKPLIDAKVDFDGLTQLLHRNIIFENLTSSIFLAEGYLYMLGWYREQVRLALHGIGYQVRHHLLKYEPTVAHQISCQKKRFKEMGWEEINEEHQRQLEVKWRKFDVPQRGDFLFDSFDVVNEENYLVTIERIVREHQVPL